MALLFKLAWRNVWRQKRRTLIVISAIMLTMGLMMVYDGLMAGFNQAIYGNAIKVLGGNIQIHASGFREKSSRLPLLSLENSDSIIERIRQLPEVVAVGKRIRTGGIATSREGAFGIEIVGIEPEAEAEISLMAKNITEGRFLNRDDGDVILIGKGLSEEMAIAVGDRIPVAGSSKHEQMRTRTLTVIGIYDLNMADLEKQYAYISLEEARNLYGLDGTETEIAIYLERIGMEDPVITTLAAEFPNVEIDKYDVAFPELKNAVGTKDMVLTIFSFVILLISGIGIMNLLLMAVYERTREIGVLGALGFSPRQIAYLFLMEGTMIGMIGLAIGVAFGLSMNLIFQQVGIDYSSYTDVASYMALISDRIYPSLGIEKLPMRTVTVFLVSLASSFVPAREASHNEPAHSLHYV